MNLKKYNFVSLSVLCAVILSMSGCAESEESLSPSEKAEAAVEKTADVIEAKAKYNFNTESVQKENAEIIDNEQAVILYSESTVIPTADKKPEDEKEIEKQSPKEILRNIKDAPAPDPYFLQVGDAMDIKVRLNPELNESVIIPPDGIISTTMAEDVMAYGRTTKELRKALTEQYSRELNSPKLSIIMRSFAPNRIYVAGEVTTPGEFVTAGPSLTLLQAIARAGGLKNSASPDNIVIIRHKHGEVPKAYLVDYESAKTGLDPASDVHLAAYDVVFVPRSGVADVYTYFQQFVQQFLPPSFGMSYQINPQNNINR